MSWRRAFATAATAGALLGFAACSGDLFDGSAVDAGANGDASADATAPVDGGGTSDAGDAAALGDASDGASDRYCEQPAQAGAFFCSDFDAPDASIAPDWTAVGTVALDTGERRTIPRSMAVAAQSSTSPVTAMAARTVSFVTAPSVLALAFDFRYEPSAATTDAFTVAQLFVQKDTGGYQIAFRAVNTGAELAEFTVGNGLPAAASPQPLAMPPASSWIRVELRISGFGMASEVAQLSYDGVVKATLVPANRFSGTTQVSLGVIAAPSLGTGHLLRFDDVVAKGN